MKYIGLVQLILKNKNGKILYSKQQYNSGMQAMQKAFAYMLAGYDTTFLKPKYINIYRDGTENSLLRYDIPITALNCTYGDIDTDDQGWYAYLNAIITQDQFNQGVKVDQIINGTVVLKNTNGEILASTKFADSEASSRADYDNGLQVNIAWKLYLGV